MAFYVFLPGRKFGRRIALLIDQVVNSQQEIDMAKKQIKDEQSATYGADIDVFYLHESWTSTMSKTLYSAAIIPFDINKKILEINEGKPLNEITNLVDETSLPMSLRVLFHRAYCLRLEISEYQYSLDGTRDEIHEKAEKLTDLISDWIEFLIGQVATADIQKVDWAVNYNHSFEELYTKVSEFYSDMAVYVEENSQVVQDAKDEEPAKETSSIIILP